MTQNSPLEKYKYKVDPPPKALLLRCSSLLYPSPIFIMHYFNLHNTLTITLLFSIIHVSARGHFQQGGTPHNRKRQASTCTAGQRYDQNAKVCVNCPTGQYQDAPGQTQCKSCLSGTYQDATGQAACKKCDPGSYQNSGGQTACILARKGHYVSISGATEDTSCSAGTYSSSTGATMCSLCPAGSKCPGTGRESPQLCSPGTFSAGGMISDCTRCSSGTFNNVNGAKGCCQCCAGWFNANEGLTNCQQCTPEAKYSNPGATACVKTQGTLPAPVATCSQALDVHTCPPTTNGGPSQIMVRRDIRRSICKRFGDKACPMYSKSAGVLKLIGHDCVDIVHDLESCGGCADPSMNSGEPSKDGGRDCSAIPNVDRVSCMGGQCIIDSCRRGYVRSTYGKTCIQPLVLQEQLGEPLTLGHTKRRAVHV